MQRGLYPASRISRAISSTMARASSFTSVCAICVWIATDCARTNVTAPAPTTMATAMPASISISVKPRASRVITISP